MAISKKKIIFSGSFLVFLEAEEEEDGVKDKGGRDATQGVHKEVELGLFEAVLLEPFENLLFLEQIAAVDGRETAPEVDHGRELGHAVLSSIARVPNLDERDVQVVRLGVNVFQLLKNFLTFGAVVFICNEVRIVLIYRALSRSCVSTYKSRPRQTRSRPAACPASFY